MVRVRTSSALFWWWASLLLGVVGMGLCGHLLARGFALLASSKPSFDLCSALFAADCDAALMDSRYWFLGVPLAGWGLVQFTTLTGYLLLGRFLKSSFETEAVLAASMVTFAGLVAGVALTLGAILGQAPVCPLCLVVHALNAMLLWSLHRVHGISLRGKTRHLQAAASWMFGSRTEAQARAHWKVVALGSGALLAVITYQWVYVEAALLLSRSRYVSGGTDSIAGYQATPRSDLPIAVDRPHLGALDSPVQLVVFASFLCPSCKRFAGTLSQLHRRFPGELLIVYRHYPLSTECNERLGIDQQQGACPIAWAAEAAHRQGRFWPFHDALFAQDVADVEVAIEQAATRANLDRGRFEADRRAAFTHDRVALDIELGSNLMIPGTPAVFLNGRLVRRSDARTLAILIRHLLEARNASWSVEKPSQTIPAVTAGTPA